MHRLLLLGSILLLGCGSEPRLENRPPKVARVEVEAEAQELFRGQRVRWIARAWDDRGGSIPEPPVRWSSTAPEIVTVDGTGELLALSVGTARIEAEIGGKRAGAEVRVREARLARLAIEPRDPRVIEGHSLRLEATVFDEVGRAYAGLPIEWSSSAPLYLRVEPDGTATGLWKGRKAAVTARHGELEDTVEVEILAPVLFVEVLPYELELLEREEVRLTPTIYDADMVPMEPRPIAWSSEDEDVARVEDGLVVGVGPGETRIVAEIEGKVSRVGVAVRPRATRIDLLLDPLEIRVGGRVPLKGVPRDARGEIVPGLDLEWSVEDEAVAHLLGRAAVEGIAPGTTRIFARNERHGVEGSATLRVDPPTHIRLHGPTAPVWPAGESFPLRLEMEDENGDIVEPKSPRWFTDDPSVATIDQQGRVKIVGVGQATVGVEVEGHVLALDRPAAVRFVEMALGVQTTCGLAANGTVWCWGRKAFDGDTPTFIATWIPEMVAEGVVAIRSGNGSCEEFPPLGSYVCDVTYGLRGDGSLVALHLGLPPAPVAAPPFVDFDATGTEICGIRPDGALHCLGESLVDPGPLDGILLRPAGHCLLRGGVASCRGTGAFDVDLSSWTFASGGAFPLSIVSRHGCGRTEDGEAVCWGENERGQVQPPPEDEVWLEPRSTATGIRSLAVADGVTLLVTEEGGIDVRGMGRVQLGPRLWSLEEHVPSFSRQGEVRSVHTGPGHHRCLLVEDGRPYCWGTNEMGQTGYRPILEPFGRYHLPTVHPLSPHPESPGLLP